MYVLHDRHIASPLLYSVYHAEHILKLADYVAEHWKSLQKADRYTILEKYYSEETL